MAAQNELSRYREGELGDTYSCNIRWQKYRRLLGYTQHYLGKPLAGKEGRPLKSVGQKKDGAGGTLEGGRWHNHALQTWCKSGEELQAAPAVEVVDKQRSWFLPKTLGYAACNSC